MTLAQPPTFDASSGSRHRLLVAEDHRGLREMLAMVLRADGHEVVEVSNGFDLVSKVEVACDPELGSGRFDLVISDVRMPGMSGLHAFSQMGYGPGTPPVVFMTAFGDEQVHEQAHQIGALAVFDKPLDFDELRAFVNNFLAGANHA